MLWWVLFIIRAIGDAISPRRCPVHCFRLGRLLYVLRPASTDTTLTTSDANDVPIWAEVDIRQINIICQIIHVFGMVVTH